MGEFYLTPIAEDHSAWRPEADVKVFNARVLETRIENSISGLLTDQRLVLRYPITAPKYNHDNLEDLSFTGEDAVNNGLPYWGVPNGIAGSAHMYVRVRNELTGAIFDTTLTTATSPLLLNNAPHIANDAIEARLTIHELNRNGAQTLFVGGDPVMISCAVLWMTEGRRTVLWSDRDNLETLCTDIREEFALSANPQVGQYVFAEDWSFNHAATSSDSDAWDVEIAQGDTVSLVSITWNHLDTARSSGGRMYLQRRNHEDYGSSPDDGWGLEQAVQPAHGPTTSQMRSPLQRRRRFQWPD